VDDGEDEVKDKVEVEDTVQVNADGDDDGGGKG